MVAVTQSLPRVAPNVQPFNQTPAALKTAGVLLWWYRHSLSEHTPDHVRTVAPVVEHSPESKEAAYQLYKLGKESGEIALELGITSNTIRSWVARYKWSDRVKIETLPGVTLDAESAAALAKGNPTRKAEPSDLELVEKQARYTEQMGDAALRISEYASTLEGKELVAAADKLLKADALSRKALKLETEKPNTIVQIALLNNQTDKPARISTRTAHEQPVIEV